MKLESAGSSASSCGYSRNGSEHSSKYLTAICEAVGSLSPPQIKGPWWGTLSPTFVIDVVLFDSTPFVCF